jgi:hypothetical protein
MAAVNLDGLRSTPLAAVGMDTTTAVPPQLVGLAVFHLAGPVITGGPYGFWAQPDAPLTQVRHELWPYVWQAPPWSEIAGHVLDSLADRVLILAAPDRLSLLRQHLPEWEPAAVLYARDLTPHTRTGTDHDEITIGRGAGLEAYTLTERIGAALLGPPPQPAPYPRGGPKRPRGPDRRGPR